MAKYPWCQLIPCEAGHAPWPLEKCKEECKTCEENGACVRWFDIPKSEEELEVLKKLHDLRIHN